MSNAVARTEEHLVLPSMDELAKTVEAEHHAVLAALGDMVEHAIKAGDALLAARRSQAFKTWVGWLKERGLSRTTAQAYMRLAHYKEIIHEAPSITLALEQLRGQPNVRNGNRIIEGRAGHAPPWLEEAHVMRSKGMTYEEIAGIVNRSLPRVWMVLNPDAPASQANRESWKKTGAKRREAERAQKIVARQEAVKRVGGGVSEAYSQVRRLAQTIDGLARNGESAEIRQAAHAASRNVQKIEDLIIQAIGAR